MYYILLTQFNVFETGRPGLAGYAACMGEVGKSYEILALKPQVKITQDTGSQWEYKNQTCYENAAD
jgi:hypothetical protein